jgi:D-hexose-6-phosphate mutarotase
LTALNRTICVEAENSTGVNLWNPGAEKNCPGVIPGDAWRRFVAVEPYAMGVNRFFVLKPQEKHVLRMKARIVEL